MWLVLCCLICAACFIEKARMFELHEHLEKVEYQYKVEKWLNSVDTDLAKFNSMAALLTWQLSTSPDVKTSYQARNLGLARNRWKNKVCESYIKKEWITKEQERKLFLLCRGPKFEDQNVMKYLDILGKLAQEYNSEVCFVGKPQINVSSDGVPKSGDCLFGEPDLERLMKRSDLDPEELKWIWTTWHNAIGLRIKKPYEEAIWYQNQAAKRNGYNDIGEVWREELETPNLEHFVFNLYKEVEIIYIMLHAVIRHKLLEKYGSPTIDAKGPIPMHLLGNMWGQDWVPLLDLFSFSPNIDLGDALYKKRQSVKDMIIDAEDFYTSLSLPAMPKKFWKHSIFEESENTTVCHGTAANMYMKDDVRMLMCGKKTMDDFYVIHHEMGHLEYYLAYQEQPAIFQDGTTTAVHESIGDALMHGVMTPQHLHRLDLLTDEQLLDNNTSLYLLFYQALSKIPEIPFSLILDKYRWDLFKGILSSDQWNDYYWYLTEKYRGIKPPDRRDSQYFDAGAKFHIPDNTPYIRYFLSSILQMQMFKSLCEITLYGSATSDESTSENIFLHRCDIYGFKNAGKRLLEMMSKGASIKWPEALFIISETPQISTKPFLEYYEPVYQWLKDYIRENNVYVGW